MLSACEALWSQGRVVAWARRDNYEITKSIAPGTIVKNWVSETAAYIKTLDKNHLARALPGPRCLGATVCRMGIEGAGLLCSRQAR